MTNTPQFFDPETPGIKKDNGEVAPDYALGSMDSNHLVHKNIPLMDYLIAKSNLVPPNPDHVASSIYDAILARQNGVKLVDNMITPEKQGCDKPMTLVEPKEELPPKIIIPEELTRMKLSSVYVVTGPNMSLSKDFTKEFIKAAHEMDFKEDEIFGMIDSLEKVNVARLERGE